MIGGSKTAQSDGQRGAARGNSRPLYVADYLANKHIC